MKRGGKHGGETVRAPADFDSTFRAAEAVGTSHCSAPPLKLRSAAGMR